MSTPITEAEFWARQLGAVPDGPVRFEEFAGAERAWLYSDDVLDPSLCEECGDEPKLKGKNIGRKCAKWWKDLEKEHA